MTTAPTRALSSSRPSRPAEGAGGDYGLVGMVHRGARRATPQTSGGTTVTLATAHPQ